MKGLRAECLRAVLSSCSNPSPGSHIWFAVTYCTSLRSVVASEEDTPFTFCGFRSGYGGKAEMFTKMQMVCFSPFLRFERVCHFGCPGKTALGVIHCRLNPNLKILMA